MDRSGKSGIGVKAGFAIALLAIMAVGVLAPAVEANHQPRIIWEWHYIDDPNGECRRGYNLVTADTELESTYDRNGNGFVCLKLTPKK